MTRSTSAAESPDAYRPPTTAPMLVPAMASTGTWFSSSTLSTPMCAAPRAPPPDSTRPMRGPGVVGLRCASCAGDDAARPEAEHGEQRCFSCFIGHL